MTDHLAATSPGRHFFEPFFFSVEDAGAGRTVHLVGAKGVEVTPEALYIHGHVSNCLGTVKQHKATVPVRKFCHPPCRINGAGRVGYVIDGHHFGARANQLLGCIEVPFTCGGNGKHADDCTAFFCHHLPGNDVAVVVHHRQQNFIAFRKKFSAPGLGYQVDGISGAAGENDFFGVGRMNKMADLFPSGFKLFGCPVGEVMRAAVDVGVGGGVIFREAPDDGGGFLRGSRVVEIHQRISTHLLIQNGKFVPDGFRCCHSAAVYSL